MSTSGLSFAAASSLNLEQLRRAVEELSAGAPAAESVPPNSGSAQLSARGRGSGSASGSTSRRASSGPNMMLVIVLVALVALAVKSVLDRFAKSASSSSSSSGDEDAWQPLQAPPLQPKPGREELLPQASRPQLSPLQHARTPEAPFDVQEFAPAPVPAAAPPHVLGEHASRQDLVQFAKDHAAYYAAQGVPEPEAMLYISNKVREVVASQQRQRESAAAARAAAAPPLLPAPMPILVPARTAPTESALPLVMKLTGDVPIAGAGGSASEERDEASGRRKKVSSESKEVEEYMRRRQSALGIDAQEDQSASAKAAAAAAAPARTAAAVSFVDPFETML